MHIFIFFPLIDRSACSKVWCQIAYWELAQRVGEFFHAKKPTVNIYGEGPVDCGGGDSMCLRDLGGKRPPSDAVQNTRQKVGLGKLRQWRTVGAVCNKCAQNKLTVIVLLRRCYTQSGVR